MKKFIFIGTILVACSAIVPYVVTTKQEERKPEVSVTSDFIDISRYREYADTHSGAVVETPVELLTETSGTTSYALDNTLAKFTKTFEDEEANGATSDENQNTISEDQSTVNPSTDELENLLNDINSIQSESDKQNNNLSDSYEGSNNETIGKYRIVSFEEFVGVE